MMSISEGLDLKLVALHKHWITADSVQYHLRRSGRTDGEVFKGVPDGVVELAQAHSMFLALSVWYGLLYVVIEGYQELGLKDEQIDKLLADTERVSALRRFRNGVFHYQQDPVPEKVLAFIAARDSEIWIRDVNASFKLFFERELRLPQALASIGWTGEAVAKRD